jgi:DNA-binding SARP family transcriptional activator
MRFGLLGVVAVRRGGSLVPVQAPMPRSVLAALLLNANRVVAADRLIDILWGDDPPATAVASLHNHVRRLRAHLADVDAERIRTVAPGYLIEMAADDLDLEVFTRLAKNGGRALAAGNWDTAATELTAALALWRGDALADVTSPVLRAMQVPRLAQLRLDTLEARIDACLHLGRYAEVIAELSELTAAHPLRERFHSQLMLACYLAGRHADALAAYRRARQILAAELGVEPGVELRRLHQRIVAADPSLTADVLVAGHAPAAAHSPTGTATAQLPPDTADFTGRDEQVRLLCDLMGIRPSRVRPGAVVISALVGMGGIGKTALAVHVAHQLRDRFPDGQLFASLQGASSPLRPAEVLARFLRALGLPDSAIPAEEAECAARYRSLLATRSMLIVLDDARDAAQVRPLLPGTASCGVIVTSRSTLSSLPGAALLSLDALGPSESNALFEAIVGTQRAGAEPDAVASVLASCAGLPLAVRIAASRLASRPGWSIAHLSARLADERRRLAELTTGDLAVRASFAVSYDALPTAGPDPARVFRFLGLAEAAVLSLPAIVALAGRPADDVARALEILTDAHLAESPAADRFRLHDLLRSYAAGLTERTDSAGERKAATGRLLGWYGEQAVIAAMTLAPGRMPPPALLARVPASAMADPAQALDWFEAERASLAAAARQSAELGRHDIAAQIAVAVWEVLQRTPCFDDWLAISLAGVSSARHLGDDAVLSWVLNSLGVVYNRMGCFPESRRCLTEALAIKQRAGDRAGEAEVLNSLAVGLSNQERFEDALECLQSALAIFVSLHRQQSAGVALHNIGNALLGAKRHDEALDHLGQALTIAERTRDRHGQGITESTLGQAYLSLGRFEEAVGHYRRGLAALQDTARDHPDQADVLCHLGSALESLGRTAEAHDAWLAAIPILDRIGDPRAADLRRRLADPANAGHEEPSEQRRP